MESATIIPEPSFSRRHLRQDEAAGDFSEVIDGIAPRI